MNTLKVGTRGSLLALTQTRWVCAQLKSAHPGLSIEEVIITTHGDAVTDRPVDASWPVGSFVTALEEALLAGEVDFAVHSYKDLPTESPQGLVIAAVPPREVPHDVLVTREPADLDNLPAGFRVGTSSPRRVAQMHRLGDIQTVPIRGNVPTRLKKIEQEDLDGVVLAAAGLKRLGIEPPYVIDLPPDRFVPAPAQGALAIQTRTEGEAGGIVAVLEDDATRRAVVGERSVLAGVNAGCQTPVGAWATVDGNAIELRGQMFSDEGVHLAESVERGEDPQAVGFAVARRLLVQLQAKA
ncbi:MAG: hydroxymethylbilane synthase [Phycisphaerales bacterium]|nr:MAG: hydroxymethylbilane synthase [Phycisphaerales bacterium]